MKIISIVLLIALPLFSNSQKQSMKDKATQEIRSLVMFGYELLGKTSKEIMDRGRPDSIKGGGEWKVDAFDTKKEGFEKTFVIGTGAGGLMVMVSEKTKLVNSLMFAAHKKAKMTQQDIKDIFKEDCEFDSKGNCVIKVANGEYIRITAGEGLMFIFAWDKAKGDIRFED